LEAKRRPWVVAMLSNLCKRSFSLSRIAPAKVLAPRSSLRAGTRGFHSSTPSLSRSELVEKEYKVLDDVTKFPSEAFDRRDVWDPSHNKAFTYSVLAGGTAVGLSGVKNVVTDVLSSLSASADVLAMANLEFDLSNVAEGQTITVKWRGKPIFIRHRTQEEITEAVGVPMAELKDPQKDEDRRKRPEWLVVLGICTHLGCVPISNAGEYKGWFCPCHGSHYDVSGRIRKGPAPRNLEIPPHKFIGEAEVMLGGSS